MSKGKKCSSWKVCKGIVLKTYTTKRVMKEQWVRKDHEEKGRELEGGQRKWGT